MRRGWPLLGVAGVVVLIAVFWWRNDDPMDLARTDAAEQARVAATEAAQQELDDVLGNQEPVATTHEDACAVEEIDDTDPWTTGPQQLRCTFTGAAVALLPAAAEAEAVALAQGMLGDRCEVPANAVRAERMNCSGGLFFAVVAADSSGDVLSAPLGGAGGTIVSADEPFDGAGLVERARQEDAGYLLWIESMRGYLTEPLDVRKSDPEPERERTCQEHSGYPNTCPGG